MQSFFSQPLEARGSELLAHRRASLRGAIGKRQNHVAVIQTHALLVVSLAGDVSQRQAFQPFSEFQESLLALAPKQHPRMRRISKIKFAGRTVKSSRNDGCQSQ